MEPANEPVYKWVTLEHHCKATGDTKMAVYMRRNKRQWVEGVHCKTAPNGRVFVNPEEYNKWVESQSSARVA